jgi:hypothetical protein
MAETKVKDDIDDLVHFMKWKYRDGAKAQVHNHWMKEVWSFSDSNSTFDAIEDAAENNPNIVSRL